MAHSEVIVDALNLSAQQQEIVRDTVRSLLDSPLFRRSKRYPAFLEFVVFNTLAGNANLLKERAVANEVFGRSNDYDPSNDPIVRYTAGEVRKRMALYFSEHPEASVRIDLPPGGYAAEFHFRLPKADEPIGKGADAREVLDKPESGEASVNKDEPPSNSYVASRTYIWWGSLLVALLAVTFLAFGVWHNARKRAEQEFWWPVLHNDSPAVVVVGEGAYPTLESGPGAQSAQQPVQPAQPSNNPLLDEGPLVLGNAVAVSEVCNVFRTYGRDCKVLPVPSAPLAEIHNSSVVLIGAFDNALTSRFLSPLRYQLRSQSSASDSVLVSRMIVDQSGADIPWKVGQNRPSGESGVDYAILARFHSDINDGMVVVIAGLGPQGTHRAADYICSTKMGAMQEIISRAPKAWSGMSFEAVLQIDLMQGSPGHVKILATQYW